MASRRQGAKLYSSPADCTVARADPRRAVQFGDRGTVQAQIFRARMKAYLNQSKPFIVGDRWSARAVVIPLERLYPTGLDLQRKDVHAKLEAAIDSFVK